jgi:hypothetical protein
MAAAAARAPIGPAILAATLKNVTNEIRGLAVSIIKVYMIDIDHNFLF